MKCSKGAWQLPAPDLIYYLNFLFSDLTGLPNNNNQWLPGQSQTGFDAFGGGFMGNEPTV